MTMSESTKGQPPRHLLERYLRLLGVSRREPSLEALTELVTAQLTRVPFENISKLLYRERLGLRDLPGLERYLEGIERYHFGGTCYANNYYLHLLLVHLGYNTMLCGADMGNPDVHIVNIAEVDGREYIVDAGYAAPFLKPLPRDLDQDYVIALGRDIYILRPQDHEGCSRLDLYRDGQLKHGYTAKPISRRIEHFSEAIARSFRKEATFMNALLVVRFSRTGSVAVRNLDIIEAEGTEFRMHSLRSREDLPGAVEDRFQIPHKIVAEAVAGLGELGDPWD